MHVFKQLEDYLDVYEKADYTKETGQRFLMEYPLQSNHSPHQFKQARITVRRINEILENKLFTQCVRKAHSECPSRFINVRNSYLESVIEKGLKRNTSKNRKRNVEHLLSRLPETVLSIEALTAADLYSAFTKYEWLSDGYITARSFFSFLFKSGMTKTNLSACVPKLTRPKPLPSVYSGDEVKQLLSAIDRSTGLGKRDYAILLLAANLGLRSSDIVGLTFKDVDRTTKTIAVIQDKTTRPATFVLNTDVEEAITDYIQNGRPQSESDKLFLRFVAPFSPLAAGSCYTIAVKYFSLAGIGTHGRRHGPHALRASYATALVAKGVPYAVVKEALGHEDRESAKYYVRLDAGRLRMCALDVPKPTGAFAVLIEPKVCQTIGLGGLEGAL